MRFSTGTICVILFFVCLFLVVLLIVFNKPEEWSWGSILLSLVLSIFQLIMSLLIVEIYLPNSKRKKLFHTDLPFLSPPIVSFHNHLKKILISSMGFKKYKQLQEDYISYNKNPEMMSDRQIRDFIKAIEHHYDSLQDEMKLCQISIERIKSSGAFGGEPDILSKIFSAYNNYEMSKSLSIRKPSKYRSLFKTLLDYDDDVYSLLGLLCIDSGNKILYL